MTLQNDLVERIRARAQVLRPRPTKTQPQTAPLSGIRAVVFDIYGTLLISASGDLGIHEESDNSAALSDAFAEDGFSGNLPEAGRRGTQLFGETVTADHAASQSAGIAYPEIEVRSVWARVCTALTEQGLLEACSLDEAAIARLALGYEIRVNPTAPMPHLRDTIDMLTRAGLALGIVSNAQFYTPLLFQAYLNKTLSALGFTEDLSVWSYVEGLGKPSVGLYDCLVKRLAVHEILPAQTLYIGNDMCKDVWAASAAGLRTALFAGDARSLRLREDDPRCQNLQPDRIVTDLLQIPDMLANGV